MSDKWDDVAWDADGTFCREDTILFRVGGVAPNPPPLKVGKIDPKTLACHAVTDIIDCGSWKTSAVMLFYIDSANRKTGNCWPSEETVCRKLGLRNPKSVSRANRFWRHNGYDLGAETEPFLKIAKKGRRKPDGTRESNVYHIGWMPLIAVVADLHWKPELVKEAMKIIAGVSVASP